MPLLSPLQLVVRLVSHGLRPVERLAVDLWCDQHRVVTQSARPGRWSTALVPYMAEPLRDFTDPDVGEIVLMWSTQVGKTEFMLNCLCYTIDVDPYPTLWVTDSKESAEEMSQDRIMTTVRASPALNRHLSGRSRDTKIKRIAFDTMTLYLTGSNSAGRLASKAMGRLLCDEIDKWPREMGGKGGKEGAAINVVRARMASYGPEGKMLISSSPTDEGVGIHAEYQRTDQAQYYVPCARCGWFQILEFTIDGKGGIRWEGGVGADLPDEQHALHAERVRQSTYYRCVKCEGRCEEHEKRGMVAAGAWGRSPAIGQMFDPKDNRPIGDRPAVRSRGYAINALYSPFLAWGDISKKFVVARGEPWRDFVNQDLGQPWRQSAKRTDELKLYDLVMTRHDTEEPYKRGQVPAGVLVLEGSIDVQDDVCYWRVRGWGEHERGWLVDYGVVKCPRIADAPDAESATEAQLAEYFQFVRDAWSYVRDVVRRPFERTPLAGGGRVVCPMWTIDSGYGKRTGEVYRFCLDMGPSVMPAKGAEERLPWRLEPVEYEDRRLGLRRQSGMNLLRFDANYWRDEVYSRLHKRPPSPSAWGWPSDLERGYIRQVTAEHSVKRRQRGREVSSWELRPGRKDNHYWDCEVMGIARAEQAGLRTNVVAGKVALVTVEQSSARAAVKPSAPSSALRSGPRAGGIRTRRA